MFAPPTPNIFRFAADFAAEFDAEFAADSPQISPIIGAGIILTAERAWRKLTAENWRAWGS